MQELFSVKDVSRLFGLSESRLRYWAQTGFVGPSIRRGTRRFYSFTDLIGIKVARELLASGLSLQRVRKNLQSLRALLPEVDQPLSRLRVASDGERMWVQSEDATFDATSGQLMLSLDTADLQEEVVRVLDLARPPRPCPSVCPAPPQGGEVRERSHREAYRWFLEGLAHEDASEQQEEAIAAYRRALELDPSLAAAHTNLGVACFRRREREEARKHFERALELDPDLPEARYNLANLYEEAGELELAIAEYRRVTFTAPDFGDAHFNLAIALERVGSRHQAAEHFRRYLELSPDDPPDGAWRRLARAHLEFLAEDSPGTASAEDAPANGERLAPAARGDSAPPPTPRDPKANLAPLPDDPPF